MSSDEAVRTWIPDSNSCNRSRDGTFSGNRRSRWAPWPWPPCWPGMHRVPPRRRPHRRLDDPLAPKKPHFAPKAKRVIYIHLTGSPPNLDLFDYKPELVKRNGQPCPDQYTKGKRFAFTSGTPKLLGTPRTFKQHGKAGLWLSDAAAAPGRGGRRPLRHPLDAYRPVQPRPGRVAGLHRLAAAGPPVARARGSPTAWAPKTRTCPASSC